MNHAAASAAQRQPRHAVLRITRSWSEAWAGLLETWLRDAASGAWKATLPSLVVVPTRAHANALKALVLEEGVSHLGLRFVTPGILRDLLLRSCGEALPAREHLRLLLAIAAEETVAHGTDELTDEQHAAKAVLRTPDHLLRTLERLTAAGWEFGDLQLRSFEPIVRRFHERLGATRLALHAELDRLALQRTANAAPLFARVLVTGFDGAHWSHWFLLRAAVQSAESATVLLEYPHGELKTDSSWIGSWEEALGEATDVNSHADVRSDSFFTDEEMRGLGRSKRDSTFLVGSDTREQAEAVALQCLRFLAEPDCTRIAVVFAGAGSLPRLVAHALTELEVPHNDGIGHSLPGVFESPEWRAWLQLQQDARINSLLNFINALPDRGDLFPDVRMRAFDRTLRSAYAELLLDDLNVLQQFCAEQSNTNSQAVAAAIRSIHFLPARSTLSKFLRETEAAFARLKWNPRWLEIARRVDERTSACDVEFSRTLYLRWLGEVASTFTKSSETAGEHPYARVQLLTVPEAHGQEWSHLIFAGWNEGSWPPSPAGEFVRDDEIAAFNANIRNLNRRAAERGRQGEGHIAIREDHSFYLGPSEQRQIALRQFETLLNSATQEVAFSSALVQENAPERFWNPSELLTRVYQQTYRKPLTQATMSSLQRATAAAIENARTLTQTTDLPSVQIEQTRVAYKARRDAETAAGEYDFAFRSPPAHVPVFSVSDLEKLVSTPALIWMKKYLGVEAADESGSPWHAATGQWVHRWLGGIAGAEGSQTFVRVPSESEIEKRVRSAAEQKAAEVKRLCAEVGKPLPDWWSSGWQNALCLARHLGAKMATASEWPWMATEWTIDADEAVIVSDGVALSFRGRIDLLLARGESPPDATSERWIVDYKTGANKPLAPAREDTEKRKSRLHNRLVKGEALQLGLYALAVRQQGAADILLSIVSPAVRAVTPQLSMGDISAHTAIFAELARMQYTGVFGMYGPLRPAFGYSRPYPLATLAIDPDLLDAKWERTHEALGREEEEFDSW